MHGKERPALSLSIYIYIYIYVYIYRGMECCESAMTWSSFWVNCLFILMVITVLYSFHILVPFSLHWKPHTQICEMRDAVLCMEMTVQRKHCSSSAVDDLFLLIIKVYDLRLSWFDMTWSSLNMTLTARLCVCVCVCVRESECQAYASNGYVTVFAQPFLTVSFNERRTYCN